MKRVAILDDYPGAVLNLAAWETLRGRAEVQVFRDHLEDPEAIVKRLQDFQVVILIRERTPLPAAIIRRLPALEMIVTTGMRNASIDTACAAQRGITVCGTRSLGYPTAELTWGLILGFMRHIPRESAAMREGGPWQSTVGRGVRGKVLGIAGYGRIGSDVARAGLAFGMTVCGWSRSLTPERAKEAGIQCVTKEALLRESDIVSLHLMLTAETRGLFGAAELALMKPSAILVNTARGQLVDEAALIDALQARRIAGAALDVFDREPLPLDHPLRRLDNVLLTPHLGYVMEENYRMNFTDALEDIVTWLDGHPLRVVAGPDAKPAP